MTLITQDQAVSERFKQLRNLAKLTQKQLGELIGYSQMHIWKFENAHSPIPPCVITLFTQNVRLLGIVVTAEWLLSGKGDAPSFDLDFNKTIDSYAEQTAQDPLTHFFSHALSLSKIYIAKLTLFVGGVDYEPHILAGTFIIAPHIEPLQFNPNWDGFYLFEYNETVIPVKLTRTRANVFNVVSLHVRDKNRVYLPEQELNSIYPATGTLSRYQIDIADAEDIANIVKKQSNAYVSISSDLLLDAEEPLPL